MKGCSDKISSVYRSPTTRILNLVLKKVILLKWAMNSATKVCLKQSQLIGCVSSGFRNHKAAFYLFGKLAAVRLCQFVSLLRQRMIAKFVCFMGREGAFVLNLQRMQARTTAATNASKILSNCLRRLGRFSRQRVKHSAGSAI